MKKKFIIVISMLLIIAIGVCANYSQKRNMSTMIMENIEALTDIELIGDELYIIEEIPCASSANELMIHYSYINCSTCKKEKGKEEGMIGKCTIIRPANLGGK